MLPAFNEKHSDRNTAVCLRHASQPMEMLDCYVTDEKRTLWIRLKCVGLQTAGGVRCFLELPHLP